MRIKIIYISVQVKSIGNIQNYEVLEGVCHNLDFQGMSFFCVQWVPLRWEVIVCFVDIGGIDDYKIWFIFNRNVKLHNCNIC
jgi:hypothetical protein